MAKHGKKYLAAEEGRSSARTSWRGRRAASSTSRYAKFNETVELSMLLGRRSQARRPDGPRHGRPAARHRQDQARARHRRGEKLKEAQEAGADTWAPTTSSRRSRAAWLDFDAAHRHAGHDALVGKLGKVLGPAGLMPNPKTGTVTFDVAKAIQEIKAGKVEFRVDKTSIIHVPVGKISFADKQLEDNASAIINAVRKAKPAAAKGKYVRSIYISSTMSPGSRSTPRRSKPRKAERGRR